MFRIKHGCPATYVGTSACLASSLRSRIRQWTKVQNNIRKKSKPNRCVGVIARTSGSKYSVHSPETVKLLRDALDDAWAALRPDERARASRSMLAARLLEVAAAGERNPARLRSAALSTVVTSAL